MAYVLRVITSLGSDTHIVVRSPVCLSMRSDGTRMRAQVLPLATGLRRSRYPSAMPGVLRLRCSTLTGRMRQATTASPAQPIGPEGGLVRLRVPTTETFP
jgi:hypothetical protein